MMHSTSRHASLACLLACFLSGSAGAQELYATDFTTLDGWAVETDCTAGYAWAADATPAARGCGEPSFRSGPACLNFNDGLDIGGDGAHGGANITCGTVVSPPIDVSGAAGGATLSFWLSFSGEFGCEWDELRLVVRSAGGGDVHLQECVALPNIDCSWQLVERPLSADWGNVEIVFEFYTHDDWFNYYSGPFIDDLRVDANCDGVWALQCIGSNSAVTGTRAVLEPAGPLSASGATLALRGSDFPMNTFAAAFYGAEPASIAFGNGFRCIAPAQSFRLPIAPTRDNGEPAWNLDLSALPIDGTILGGSTWHFQAIYRDGAGFNFSDAVVLRFCD